MFKLNLLLQRFIAGLASFILCGAPLTAGDLQFLSLFPENDSAWTALVEGKQTKKKDQLVFWADGTKLDTTLEEAGKNRLRAKLSGVPEQPSRIAVGTEGKKGPRELAAVQVGVSPKQSFGDLTVYHIMMGFFKNGNTANDGQIHDWKHPNYAGGDLQGVLEKVDYLAELGVTAVWLSPVFQARTSHGYDVLDYYRIGDAVAVPENPDASLQLFRQVRDALKAKGIRLIMDVPLNHAHRSYDRDHGDPNQLAPRATGARQEAEKVWESWGTSFKYWNFAHQPTRQFLTEVALHWLVDEKADGLRLDYVRGVPHDYWAELYAAVKAKKPEAFLVGEAWMDAAGADGNMRDIALYYEEVDGKPQFDSLLDFPMQITATDVFGRKGSAVDLESWLQTTAATYGNRAQPTYFLDNHDLSRFLSWGAEKNQLVSALGFFAALSSPMVVFYGSETGLANAGPKPGFIDSGRIVMPWGALDQEMVDQVAEIFKARQAHPAMTHGGRIPLHVDPKTLLMAKLHPEGVVLVGVHLDDEDRTVEVEVPSLLLGEFKALTQTSQIPQVQDGKLVWTLKAGTTSLVGIQR